MGEPRRGNDADDRHRAEDDQRDPQHAAGEALRLPLLGTIEQVDERGHEDGRERARGEQLEQHVRHVVRGGEGVAEVGRAENRRDRENAGEADHARGPGGRPHTRGRS